MAELFKAKVRKVGTSLGVLMPMKIIRKENIQEGSEVDLVIMKKNLKLLDEVFGSAKNTMFKFKRDKRDRF